MTRRRRAHRQATLGTLARPGAPLSPARRPLHTGASLPPEKQHARLVAAYREPDKNKAKQLMRDVINSVSSGVPTALIEIRRLGRTLKQRAIDVLAFFDRPGTSNGSTEAINGRLEHLRGSALGFRNLTNHVARSLLEAGGFRPALHPRSR